MKKKKKLNLNSSRFFFLHHRFPFPLLRLSSYLSFPSWYKIQNKKKRHTRSKMGLLPPFVGAIIFCILQFIVFLFVLVSTPIDQLKSRHSDECWTFFGSKKRCSDAKRQSTGTAAFGCVHRRDNMSAGGAFAIISIFSTLAAFVFGVLMLVRIPCAVLIPLLLTCFSVVTILISWACIAGVYG